MNLPPYPRFGECIRALAAALDTKASNRDVDRLAREGDLDWSLLNIVIDELLIDGTRRFLGPLTDELFKPWLRLARDRYSRLVLDVPLDSVERSQAMPVLVEEFFAPCAAQLLMQLNAQRPGPDLGRFLEGERTPFAAVFEWLDEKAGGPFDKCLYPQTTGQAKSSRDKLGKWRNGVDLPSGQSLKLLLDDLRAEPKTREYADAAGVWLLTARALAHFDQQRPKPIRPLLRIQIQTGSMEGRARQRLQSLAATTGFAWPEMADLGRRLWHDLQRLQPKQVGDQASVWSRIQLLEKLVGELDSDSGTAYHLAWLKGRWHALSGRYEAALPHYEQAFGLACYRAGSQIKEIVEDAICIAAFQGKKVFVKQLKQVGIAFGLFLPPRDDSAVEVWELEQLEQQLTMRFPAHGRFVESEPDLADSLVPGLMMISMPVIQAMKPDLANSNRVRKIRFENGGDRRWPQLSLFASFGRCAQIKMLLNAGASVDQLDSSGASALLCAIQYAQSSGEHAALDLLLGAPHQATTLNAMTARKRLTPLMCAIDLGEPDVVLKLLDRGANADQLALTDHQSPLYYTVSMLYGRVRPQRMLEGLSKGILSDPDAVKQDTLRRFGIATAGAFGDDMSLMRAEPELALQTATYLVDEHVRRHSVDKLTQIVALLLRFGADPNRGHGYPVPGRTPLMLAAESDLPAVFELMVDSRGDPWRPDAEGKNCIHIATEFGSHRVLSLLQGRR